MSLLDRTGLIDDPVAFAPLGEVPIAASRTGVVVPPDVAVATVLDQAGEVDCVAITVPATGDGRVFSLAAALRERGFGGTIRAVGPLIPDQFAFALDCGIDQVEIPDDQLDRQPVGQWLAALDTITRTYVGQDGIFARRAAGTAAS